MQTCFLSCLRLLAKRGVNVNKKNGYGLTQLDHARMVKHPECVDLLLSNGTVGTSVEDLPVVSEDVKVLCMYVWLRQSVSSLSNAMSECSHLTPLSCVILTH